MTTLTTGWRTFITCCVSSTRSHPPVFFCFQAEDGIRALYVTGVQTCALPIFAAVGSHRVVRQVAFAANVVDERVERSEEHTSELQSRRDLVCRLLLEKKK